MCVSAPEAINNQCRYFDLKRMIMAAFQLHYMALADVIDRRGPNNRMHH